MVWSFLQDLYGMYEIFMGFDDEFHQEQCLLMYGTGISWWQSNQHESGLAIFTFFFYFIWHFSWDLMVFNGQILGYPVC